MSVRVMAEVWANSVATGTTLLVQLALADHAEDEKRSCFPSVTHIAKKCRVGESTARRHIHELEKKGELRIELHGGGNWKAHDSQRPNRYVLREYPKTPPVNLTPGVTGDTCPPVTGDTTPLSRVTPEPSLTITESSLGDSPSAKPRGAREARTAKKPDLVFETIADVCGIDLAELTKSSRGALNDACKQLRDIGATPDEIRARARAYRQKFSNISLTPSALVKHWPTLGATTTDTTGNGTRPPPPDNLQQVVERRQQAMTPRDRAMEALRVARMTGDELTIEAAEIELAQIAAPAPRRLVSVAS
jgi:biotin operon repressor